MENPQEEENPPVEEEASAEGEKASNKEEDYKEKYYYLAAEMENLKKRHGREREELLKYGTERLIKALLGVVDDLERAVQAIEKDEREDIKNIHQGIDMVKVQFLTILKEGGLQAVEALGKVFDPHFHEAVGRRKDEDKKDNEILEEYQKGYLLNGRLIRPAKVAVVKNEPDKE